MRRYRVLAVLLFSHYAHAVTLDVARVSAQGVPQPPVFKDGGTDFALPGLQTLPPLAGTLRDLWHRYAALGRAETAFIAALVLCAVYVGGTKPTNTQPQALSGGIADTAMTGGAARISVTEDGEPQRLSTNQCLAGFAL